MANIREYFDNYAQDWNRNYQRQASFRERMRVFRESIARALENRNIRSVLEVGCGSYSMFDSAGRDDIDYFACDFSFEMLMHNQTAKNLFQADFMKMPVQRKFDMLILSSVVEWLAEPEAAPELAAKLVQPGGSLLVSYPNGQSITRVLERHLITPVKRLVRQEHYTTLQKPVNYNRMQSLFGTHGFKISNVVYFGKKLAVPGRYSSSLRLDTYIKV